MASSFRWHANSLVGATELVERVCLLMAPNTIPIVFVVVNDPVGQGFISNLAHPGGNVTGFSFIEPEIVGKWVNLLVDVKPDLSRVALMFNPDTAAYYEAYLHSFKAAAIQSRGGCSARAECS